MEGLDRYEQDWATKGLAHQYLKNKQSYGYRKGILNVPEKYQYLKGNAAQRSEAPRGNAHKRKADQANLKEAIAAKKACISKGKEKVIREEQEEAEEGSDGREQESDGED